MTSTQSMHKMYLQCIKQPKKSVNCKTCNQKEHDYSKEEHLACVLPKDVLQFGPHQINKKYREALFSEYSFYNSEEIIGSFLGHNPYFPSQSEWLQQQEEQQEAEEYY
eukprot:244361_1